MPRKARLVIPGYPHHVTQRGNRRQQVFFSASDYRAYLDLLVDFKGKAGVDIWAYCLMPNHVHMIAVPHRESSLADCFGTVHKRYADRINTDREWTGHLWQERFHSVVMDEAHLLVAVKYVELNPVGARLCARPEEWRWSSTSVRLTGIPDQVLTLAPMYERISDWRAYLSQESDPQMLGALRKRTRTGRPVGDDDFIRGLEKMTGTRLRPKKRGRPRKSKEEKK
jgi:putative transposase